jgi:hypothetical protein
MIAFANREGLLREIVIVERFQKHHLSLITKQ